MDLIKFQADIFPMLRYPKRELTPFSPAWFPNQLARKINDFGFDLVHLHWVCGGMLPLKHVARIKAPVVWTFHDSWPFTGGCHLPGACMRYQSNCGRCPVLGSHNERDLSAKVLARKKKFWAGKDMALVAPSRWLANAAESSSLFHGQSVRVIAHGLDLERFKPIDKSLAKSVLKFNEKKTYILFGAHHVARDPNKGGDLFIEAMKELASQQCWDSVEIVVFGTTHLEGFDLLGFKVHFMGTLQDELSMVLLYNACDVMVVPSLSESFGLTAAESMACGIPVVAFGATGLLDIVDHQVNGYCAQPYEAADLAAGIRWVLDDSERYTGLCHQARQKAINRFDQKEMTQKYMSLYQSVIGKKENGTVGVGEGGCALDG